MDLTMPTVAKPPRDTNPPTIKQLMTTQGSSVHSNRQSQHLLVDSQAISKLVN